MTDGEKELYIAAVTAGLVAEFCELYASGKRYRWLRENPAWVGYDADYRPDQIDMAIDHAMTQPPNDAVQGSKPASSAQLPAGTEGSTP
ncbi:MAG: hypothetical protein KKF85_03560 [Gammaproteobacteria bacterium]|nr:hypothetical protein [Rhodocyclaceae bacterium]MBU3908900.1 hypothetical protein [Gammaproteobacteria bacterium]MBU3987767.1 hypothetical protein [Gammaproteobacteria bacterium]MBU4003378.1 hypothetical protein [Gammaproteobacteria bacterium]MBU4021849.1 hypothetical protein [Gammaproteobacteria bacterium]